MKQEIEYRVRAVTRYVVTRNDPGGTESSTALYETVDAASKVAGALAHAEGGGSGRDTKTVRFVPYEGPPPGKVMRCKVSMTDRRVNVASATDEKGAYLGKMIDRSDGRGGSYRSPDPADPTNWRPDGEHIRFSAVCAGFDKDGVANVEENRIFGFWSPSVNFDAVVRNESVLQNLELGGEYYVDFIPAPKPEAA